MVKSPLPESTVMTGAQIRQTFLEFYAARGHAIKPSASLVPEDPTVLLTIAGMLPFKPIFLGQRQADVDRAVSSQKCIRTNDIENVGRTARHHTFFEMLGNFSFGDYFKEQAIAWAWELSTQVFHLPPSSGGERLPGGRRCLCYLARSDWHSPHRIIRMGAADNFWASGPTGPCGPCSEIYYDFHPELGDGAIDLEDDSRFIEFYNLVFMQYNRDGEGHLTPLQNQNIDTGLGLERMAQILQQVPNNYETDLIFPIIETAARLAGLVYRDCDAPTQVSLKVIGDHSRAVVHMVADGITASNVGRGYVLRRLIRRVVRHGRLIGIQGAFISQVAETAIQLAQTTFANTRERAAAITAELDREEARFLETLERGEKLLADILERERLTPARQISGADAFVLYDTYGFPLELTQEVAEEQGLTVDLVGFEAAMAAQRQRSQAAHETIDLMVQGSLDSLADHIHSTQFVGYSSASTSSQVVALLVAGQKVDQVSAGQTVQVVLDQTPFYAESGGQIGDRGYLSGAAVLMPVEDVQKDSDFFVHLGRIERGTLAVGDRVTAQIDQACRRRLQAHHSATHLLQAALKKLVDSTISQAGSLVAFDRLRFDFNCPRPLTSDEVQQVEDQVNQWIGEGHLAEVAVMALEEAKQKGAVAMFGEKYGAEVRVIDFPGVSMELCGGTHVSNTAAIGLFKIIAETGVASGIRRIEAVAGPALLPYLNLRDRVVRDLCDRFKVKPEAIGDRITSLQAELKQTQKDLVELQAELSVIKANQLLPEAVTVGGLKVLVAELPGSSPEALKTAGERLLQKLGVGAVVLGTVPEPGKVSLVAAFSPEAIAANLQAGKFIGAIAKLCGGGGGGKPNLAQAGGRDSQKLPEALEIAKQQLLAALQKSP
ncbi:MAG: alanine--tRNA ligase [Nodosilinea sp. LVE1205-7]